LASMTMTHCPAAMASMAASMVESWCDTRVLLRSVPSFYERNRQPGKGQATGA
jgi:hypothetical protein